MLFGTVINVVAALAYIVTYVVAIDSDATTTLFKIHLEVDSFSKILKASRKESF